MTTNAAPFGQMVTAMITPMTPDGTVDYDGAARLADYLITDMRNDGLVVNGTTGEAPTTTDAEKERLLRVVLEAVGSRAKVVAGVGTNVTAHTIELARSAERVGVHGLLVVTPYYNKPPQPALEAHFTAVADATGPARAHLRHPRPDRRRGGHRDPGPAGRAPADHRRQGRQGRPGRHLARAGPDRPRLLLRHRHAEPAVASLGAVGFVSVVGHVVGDRLHEMIDAFGAGDVARARQLHYELVPVYDGLFRNQGAVMAKAALDLLGLPGGAVRAPLLAATEAERHRLALDLTAGGVKLPGTSSAPGAGTAREPPAP